MHGCADYGCVIALAASLVWGCNGQCPEGSSHHEDTTLYTSFPVDTGVASLDFRDISFTMIADIYVYDPVPGSWTCWLGNQGLNGWQNTNSGQLQLCLTSSQLKFGFYSNDLDVSYTLTAATWTRITGVYDAANSEQRLYVDEVLVGTRSASAFQGNTGQNIKIGLKYNNADSFGTKGEIRNVYLYTFTIDVANIGICAGDVAPSTTTSTSSASRTSTSSSSTTAIVVASGQCPEGSSHHEDTTLYTSFPVDTGVASLDFRDISFTMIADIYVYDPVPGSWTCWLGNQGLNGWQNANSGQLQLCLTSSQLKFGFYSNDLDVSYTLTAATWTRITGVYDAANSEQRLYVDEVLVGTRSASAFQGNTGQNIKIGLKYNNADSFGTKGEIRNVYLYTFTIDVANIGICAGDVAPSTTTSTSSASRTSTSSSSTTAIVVASGQCPEGSSHHEDTTLYTSFPVDTGVASLDFRDISFTMIADIYVYDPVPGSWTCWFGNQGLNGWQNTNSGQLQLCLTGSQLKFGFYSNDLDVSYTLTAATWTRITGVYDAANSEQRLYVDEVLVGTRSASAFQGNTGQNIKIGLKYNNADSFGTKGEIRNVYLYTFTIDVANIGICAGDVAPSTTTSTSSASRTSTSSSSTTAIVVASGQCPEGSPHHEDTTLYTSFPVDTRVASLDFRDISFTMIADIYVYDPVPGSWTCWLGNQGLNGWQNTNSGQLQLCLTSSQLKFGFYSNDLDVSYTLMAATWTRITGVYDAANSEQRLYVDEVLVGTRSASAFQGNTGQNIKIGLKYNNADSFGTKGEIRNVYLYTFTIDVANIGICAGDVAPSTTTSTSSASRTSTSSSSTTAIVVASGQCPEGSPHHEDTTLYTSFPVDTGVASLDFRDISFTMIADIYVYDPVPGSWTCWLGNQGLNGWQNTNSGQLQLCLTSSQLKFGFYSNDLDVSYTLTAATWTRITGVYDAANSEQRLYVDEVLVGTRSASAFQGNTGQNINIGLKYNNADSFGTKGEIRNVYLYTFTIDVANIGICAGDVVPSTTTTRSVTKTSSSISTSISTSTSASSTSSSASTSASSTSSSASSTTSSASSIASIASSTSSSASSTSTSASSTTSSASSTSISASSTSTRASSTSTRVSSASARASGTSTSASSTRSTTTSGSTPTATTTATTTATATTTTTTTTSSFGKDMLFIPPPPTEIDTLQQVTQSLLNASLQHVEKVVVVSGVGVASAVPFEAGDLLPQVSLNYVGRSGANVSAGVPLQLLNGSEGEKYLVFMTLDVVILSEQEGRLDTGRRVKVLPPAVDVSVVTSDGTRVPVTSPEQLIFIRVSEPLSEPDAFCGFLTAEGLWSRAGVRKATEDELRNALGEYYAPGFWCASTHLTIFAALLELALACSNVEVLSPHMLQRLQDSAWYRRTPGILVISMIVCCMALVLLAIVADRRVQAQHLWKQQFLLTAAPPLCAPRAPAHPNCSPAFCCKGTAKDQSAAAQEADNALEPGEPGANDASAKLEVATAQSMSRTRGPFRVIYLKL